MEKLISSINRQICCWLLCIALILLSGCAWQRIPDYPQYDIPNPIPAKIGIILGNTPSSQVYGPIVVNHLMEMELFDSIIYPYREGDSVDGTIELTVTGGWKAHSGPTGFIIGLSLFTLSPFIGPGMTGTHDIVVTFDRNGVEIVNYDIHVETSVSWGLGANTSDVSQKCDKLQTRKLAVEIAKRIEEDKQKFISMLWH